MWSKIMLYIYTFYSCKKKFPTSDTFENRNNALKFIMSFVDIGDCMSMSSQHCRHIKKERKIHHFQLYPNFTSIDSMLLGM